MLLVVLLYGALAPSTPPLTQRNVDEAIASALASVTPPPAFSEQVFQAVQPSLVLVKTTGVHDPNTAPSDAPDTDAPSNGLGSGVVVNADGDILTSLHVIDGAKTIDLTFFDGSTSPAEVVSTQPDHDIAVLHATQPPAQLYPATLGNPRSVQQGSEAYAMGSPLGSGSVKPGSSPDSTAHSRCRAPA